MKKEVGGLSREAVYWNIDTAAESFKTYFFNAGSSTNKIQFASIALGTVAETSETHVSKKTNKYLQDYTPQEENILFVRYCFTVKYNSYKNVITQSNWTLKALTVFNSCLFTHPAIMEQH